MESSVTCQPTTITGKCNSSTQKEKENTKKGINCYCYNKSSLDSRCCGACYCLCPVNDKIEQCYFCPYTLLEYWNSGYVQTSGGYGGANERCSNDECSFCCIICFPIKLPLFFPCLIGASFNHCINYIRGGNTEHNYLF